MNEEELKAQEERQERNLDLLFSPYLARDEQRDLRALAEYFEYVADNIRYKRLHITTPTKFLKRFEAAYLMFRQTLSSYPESVQEQATSICEGLSLERLFAALVIEASEERGASSGERSDSFNLFAAILSGLQAVVLRTKESVDQALVNRNSLLNAKIALGRMAQLALYVSSTQTNNASEEIDQFSDHYSPDLADKAKILTLLHVLRSQTNGLSDIALKRRLIETLDKVETEIRKPRPRWRIVITTFFVLFGFLADLKTIEPHIYGPLYRTTEAIVHVLHEEGSVEHHRRKSTLPPDDHPQPLLPQSSETMIRSEEEDDDD